LALEHDQLLAQKGVFRDQLGLAARDVRKRTEDELGLGWLEASFDFLFERCDNTTERLTDGLA
jgi:hypothetical protein